jgi:hypothetical protein
MKYLPQMYTHLKRRNDIIIAAQDAGLEFTVDDIFYDPKNERYDAEYRRRLLQENQRSNQELLDLGEFDQEAHYKAGITAAIIFDVLHPISMLKTGISIIRGYQHR